LLDPRATFQDNVIAQVLNPAARLHDEAERILDVYLGEAAVHYAIVQAIANGNETWQAITRSVGKSSGSLSRPMRWLTDMEVVRKEVPVTSDDSDGGRTLYRLADPYVAFWMRNVRPLRAAGTTALQTPEEIWERHISGRLDDSMGRVFEDVCRAFVSTGLPLAFTPDRVGRWWGGDGASEIDVVGLADGDLFVAECKWGVVGSDDVRRLRASKAQLLLETRSAPRVHEALFSGRGEFTSEVRRAATAESIRLFGPEDLYPDMLKGERRYGGERLAGQ
jgi:AAA+ ATPase superfamily predicted ATPase